MSLKKRSAGFMAALVVAGLIISYHANTSGSATMAVIPIALFFIVLTVRNATAGIRNRRADKNVEVGAS